MQLRIYIEQYHIRPSIDDTYQAEAVNEDTLGALFEEKASQLIKIVIILQTLGVSLILVSIAMIAICTIKGKQGQRFYRVEIKHKPAINKQAILISASVNGTVFLLYAVALDIAAIYYRSNSLLSDLETINHKDKIGRPFDILYNLPIVVVVFDAVAALPCIIMLFIVIVHFCYKGSDKNNYSICQLYKVILLGPMLSIAAHSPFIAIAYINDAYYAGSIFIYYVVILFACFAAVHLTMNACLKSIVLEDELNIWNLIFENCCKLKGKKNTENKSLEVRRKCSQTLCPIAIMFLMLFFILVAVVIVILYFIIIPLNGSVSGAPHQLFGFYQTIIIFLGIFITYKTVLHKKHSGLKYAIKKRESLHTDVSDEDKRLKFYGMVIDLVEHFHEEKVPHTKRTPKQRRSTDDSGTETQTAVTETSSGSSSAEPTTKPKGEKKGHKLKTGKKEKSDRLGSGEESTPFISKSEEDEKSELHGDEITDSVL